MGAGVQGEGQVPQSSEQCANDLELRGGATRLTSTVRGKVGVGGVWPLRAR